RGRRSRRRAVRPAGEEVGHGDGRRRQGPGPDDGVAAARVADPTRRRCGRRARPRADLRPGRPARGPATARPPTREPPGDDAPRVGAALVIAWPEGVLRGKAPTRIVLDVRGVG